MNPLQWSFLLKGHGRFLSLLTHEMFLTICQELGELFTEDEVESCFGDESEDEAMDGDGDVMQPDLVKPSTN